MKKIIFTMVVSLLAGVCLLHGQGNFVADFETFDTTPYVFRYGNNANVNYYPRWQYSHETVDNPLIDVRNPSSKVLRYTSLEARNYGLKIRFPSALYLEDIDTIRFQVYQPASVIGQAADASYSASSATSQEIRVKLLTYFNTIKDHKEDDGVVLTFNGSVQPFTTGGEWIDYRVAVNESKFSQANVNKLASGILGFAILPTYGSNVTLQSRYVCYIDNIGVKRERSTGLDGNPAAGRDPFRVYYTDSRLIISSTVSDEAVVSVFDMTGRLVSKLGAARFSAERNEYPIHLPNGVYVVSIFSTQGKSDCKLFVSN
ncbi:MAG: T9SS type A sorting domain-containing protein [Dysgonamonadaceae bacterium]|jgi:hypothetical protein|nr:T9SS type A sorting domain-containing protein [Dysgonamonadaceae bacterium]